jgi:hypothetical protein
MLSSILTMAAIAALAYLVGRASVRPAPEECLPEPKAINLEYTHFYPTILRRVVVYSYIPELPEDARERLKNSVVREGWTGMLEDAKKCGSLVVLETDEPGMRNARGVPVVREKRIELRLMAGKRG